MKIVRDGTIREKIVKSSKAKCKCSSKIKDEIQTYDVNWVRKDWQSFPQDLELFLIAGIRQLIGRLSVLPKT